MRKLTCLLIAFGMCSMFALTPAAAQERKGAISGHVTDATRAVVQGARVEVQPGGQTAVSDREGEFTITGLVPGRYKIIVSAMGFAVFSNDDVAVATGSTANVDAVLKIESPTEVVEVRAEREHGEVEALNRERTADNILQVLPAEVITSLPNANIADAVGRLPSVTLERDEGEGKYIQIRGTEPRLTNVTIDGINVPSPESGVRQIKLDAMASDLVESVEINKTLQANQDGDGIGGSVNLKTKTAGDVPTFSAYGLGGYTPIIGGRGVDQFGTTIGQRFGARKQWGFLMGGTYDWNGRGINDIEPVPDPTSLTPHYLSMDMRDYEYYRTRWGLAGSTDYRLNEGSNFYLRWLYSDFKDYGHKWVYTLVDGPFFVAQGHPGNAVPQASQDWRRPDYGIGSIVLGGRHMFQTSWLNWELSVARSRTLDGSGGANYMWTGDPNVINNCGNIPTQDQFRPAFSPGCFTPGAGDITDIRNYSLAGVQEPNTGLTAQLNLQASASYAHQYHIGSRFGIFEFGGKIRNEHKFEDTQQVVADLSANPVPAGQFLGTFTDPNYYDGTYHFTNTPDYRKARDFAAGLGAFISSPSNSNFTLIERVTAGYVMNTLDLTPRLRLVAGVRFEATHLDTPTIGTSDYLDVLPSASLRIGVAKDSALRLVYSRALSRPDPQDIAQGSGTLDNTVTPNAISLGNPNLRAEHSNNYDVLFEQYLNPVGMIQAGFFYKQLSDPIVNGQFAESPSLFANQPVPIFSPYVLVSEVQNIGSAWLTGVEVAYTQRLRFLPGVMKGAGISANYSHTTSGTSGLQALLRDDNPPLLRQAPNTWNISPTYDTKRFSMRVGMTYNAAMIFAYQFQDLVPGTTAIVPGTPPVGGVTGPAGDNYLYPHYQIDVQASYKLPRGFSVYGYGLNLNNEVFGFYNGSPQYVVQREYYHPTYAGGVRWTLGREQ